jgi:hypothetical protein
MAARVGACLRSELKLDSISVSREGQWTGAGAPAAIHDHALGRD